MIKLDEAQFKHVNNPFKTQMKMLRTAFEVTSFSKSDCAGIVFIKHCRTIRWKTKFSHELPHEINLGSTSHDRDELSLCSGKSQDRSQGTASAEYSIIHSM